MNINNWYTVRHHVLVHNWMNKQNVLWNPTGAVWWLVYEMVEKNNIRDNAL